MQNASPRSLQQPIRIIKPLNGVRRKATAEDERPEDEQEELYACQGDLQYLALRNCVIVVVEQQANQNELDHQDKQPVDAINLEDTNNYVEVTEGHNEIHKDAIFFLEFYKFFKEHQNKIP